MKFNLPQNPEKKLREVERDIVNEEKRLKSNTDNWYIKTNLEYFYKIRDFLKQEIVNEN